VVLATKQAGGSGSFRGRRRGPGTQPADQPSRGAKNAIRFHARRDIDLGLAAMMSTLPEFFAFNDDEEKKLFIAEGVLIAAITELTQFPAARGTEIKRNRAA